MTPPLPRVPDHIDLKDWEQRVQPELDALSRGPADVAAVPQWLESWSDLGSRIAESASLTSIEYSRDTQDPERRENYFHYIRQVSPKLRTVEQQLKTRLLESGWDGDESMQTVLRRFRTDAALFREENVALQAEEQATAARYDEIAGGLTVEFDGEERTLPQLATYRESPDRAVRARAWRASMDAFLAVRETLDELYDQLYRLRRQIAANAGFDSYRDYKWQQLGRFDYSPDDALTFHASIREKIVPALARRAARRAEALGIDTLRPWDIDVDPYGPEPLSPFKDGAELADVSARIFDRVDPLLGERVRTMRDAQLLDLENRKGKAPGGYCATLHQRGLPFIFMNAVGTDDNVRTMLHEAGHAFHVFEGRSLPYIWQRHAPMEFAEVASMSMELLTAPYISLDEGGFYPARDALRSRAQHLERMLFFLPYMAVVSAFQHWVYTHPDHEQADRDATWLRLHQEYCVGVDWSGFEASRMSLWHQKLHIFRAPFYYIEYGIAQMGALQLWRNSMDDPQRALAQYREALALGGTRTLPELFEAAGAKLAFDAESIGELVELIESQLDETEARLAALA